MLEYRVLGPLEVITDGSPMALGGAKQRALLALLLLEGGRAVSTRRLTDDLWGATPPVSAAKALQVYVSQLRKALGGDAIETRPDAYVVRSAGISLDLTRFEELAEAGRSQVSAGRPVEGARLFAEALALWRGDALEGLDEPGLAPLRARLDELRLVVYELWADARLAAGRHAELVPELALLAERHPLRERLHEQLMLALYRDGRQAEALAAFRRLRDRLNDELGLEPRSRVRRLEQSILRQDGLLEVARDEKPQRSIVAAGPRPARLAALLGPLAREISGELILFAPVAAREELAAATALLEPHRSGETRVAAFVTRDPGRDVLRLAVDEGAELVVLERAPEALAATQLEQSACDVAVFVDADGELPSSSVTVLFGGAPEDWKAIEVAAVFSRACGVPLRLAGVHSGGGDASTLLARAALVVQRFAGIATEPALFDPELPGSLAEIAAGGTLVAGVAGGRGGPLPASRVRLADLGVPLLLIVPGPRPGLLAPAHTLTRFSWSLLG
jgi:DNA-binding SARP family transcriptional activator